MKGISSVDNIVRPILLQRYHVELVFQQPGAGPLRGGAGGYKVPGPVMF